MLKERAKLVSRVLNFIDLGVTVVSFFVAYWIRAVYLTHWDLSPIYPIGQYAWLLLVIIPVWTYLLHFHRAYFSFRTVPFYKEMENVWKAVISGGVVIATVAFVFKLHFLSRTLIMTFVIVNMALVTLERFAIRSLSWKLRRRGLNYRRVLIVGTNDTGLDIARRIENYGHWGLRVAGFVSDNDEAPVPAMIDQYQIMGKLEELERIVTQETVDEVIFSVPGKGLAELEDKLLMLEDHGVNARIAGNIFPNVIAKLTLEELETVQLLTFSTTPQNATALAVKRLFDITAALVLLFFSAPVMALAALLIKITSPGPVLFKQSRLGLHGRVFTLYKFRSMYNDAEKRKKELEELNEMEGPVFKIRNDPRVTPIGRFIRKTSIDELPQLWNVLRGDMSIVGPRPPLPEEVSRYDRWQRRRLSMRPGLTCLWQISGRNQVRKFDDWVKMDLQYIDTWSLSLDLLIFLKTIPVVLFRKGAA